jgi:hypothetical protein
MKMYISARFQFFSKLLANTNIFVYDYATQECEEIYEYLINVQKV